MAHQPVQQGNRTPSLLRKDTGPELGLPLPGRINGYTQTHKAHRSYRHRTHHTYHGKLVGAQVMNPLAKYTGPTSILRPTDGPQRTHRTHTEAAIQSRTDDSSSQRLSRNGTFGASKAYWVATNLHTRTR